VGLAEDPPDKAGPVKGKAGEKDGDDGNGGKAPESAGLKLLESAGQKAVTLLISAGGLLGFVAFAGSIVLWSRFFAIHVPPDQVVAAVPQGESIAVGAVMLLLFGFFGALATIAVYLIDRGGRATPGMSRALLVILTIEAAIAIWIAGDSTTEAKVIATEILAIAFTGALWCTFVGGLVTLEEEGLPDLVGDEPGQELKETPFWKRGNKTDVTVAGVLAVLAVAAFRGGLAFGVAHLLGASAGLSWIIALAVVGAVLLLAVGIYCWLFQHRKALEEKAEQGRKKKLAEKEEKRETEERERREREAQRPAGRIKIAWARYRRQPRCRGCRCRPCACHLKPPQKQPVDGDADGREKPPQLELTMLGSAVIVLLALIAAGGPSLILGEWWLGVSLGIVFVIGCGLWRIAYFANKRFIWLGLAVFISVPLFGALMLMVRNLAEPQVQAVALIRSGDGPDEAIQGLYVTETSDRVYFANVATEGCSETVKPASGRLLWVRKDEVVAMSIGPLEGVEDAGKSALEMAYALTPAIETPAGDHFSQTPSEKRSQAKKAEAAAPTEKADEAGAAGAVPEGGPEEPGKAPAAKKVAVVPVEGRLEDPGPAVRPNFGAGLRLDPETASPGEVVTLSMSAPNEDVDGFGRSREGRNLRLGGVIADILKERAVDASSAEYIEVGPAPGGSEERLLKVAKGGAYVLEGGKFKSLEEAGEPEARQRYVKLDDPALREVNGTPVSVGDDVYVKVHKPALRAKDGTVLRAKDVAVAPVEDSEVERIEKIGAILAKEVTLAGGELEGTSQERETFGLTGLSLYRQAWHRNRIRFRVPEHAKSGVVTVECGQLAGSPLLRVSHAPTARIAVRMRANSREVTLSSSRSGDEDGEKITRRWTIEGIPRGRRPRITTRLPLRPDAYSIKLTVADQAGHLDTAALRLLRLPDSLFDFGKSEPDEQSKNIIGEARRSLASAIAATTPVAIELDGHADNPGAASLNLKLSLERADQVRRRLMPEPEGTEEGDFSLPVEELAYGESCPIEPGPGRHPRNRRVEVFVLDEGVTVKPPKGCIPGRLEHASWYPATSGTKP
jgi:outer membrane protein OmpA-like peptidoglycan-associated protein